MGKSIAIVGKGGVGKTTISYLIAKSIINKGIKPFIIDADPTMSHLAKLFNIKSSKNLEQIRTQIIKTAISGTETEKISLGQNIDQIIEDSLIETENYTFFVLGQPENPGCFCASNSLLRDVITAIINKFNVIIIDCEAGLEHIHRNVLKTIDILIIVSDQSIRSLETARSIKESANKFIQHKKSFLILNKIKNNNSEIFKKTAETFDIPILAVIPEDINIINSEMEETTLKNLPSNSPSQIVINEITDKLLFESF